MHALIVEGEVLKYPYTIGMLRKDNPNTSFPKRPTEKLLSEWGMEPVIKSERPNVDYTKNVSEGNPQVVDGVWTQVWVVTDASEDEVAERIEQKSQEIRSQRAALIVETDWMALNDTTLTTEWAAYRQALRDITNQEGFPWSVTWPTKPE